MSQPLQAHYRITQHRWNLLTSSYFVPELSHVCLQIWLVWTCPRVWHWEAAWWRLPIITSEYRDTRPASRLIMSYLWFLPALDVGSVTHRCRSVGDCGRWWQDECSQWADCHGLWSVRFVQKGNRNYLFRRYQIGNPIYSRRWTEKMIKAFFFNSSGNSGEQAETTNQQTREKIGAKGRL